MDERAILSELREIKRAVEMNEPDQSPTIDALGKIYEQLDRVIDNQGEIIRLLQRLASKA